MLCQVFPTWYEAHVESNRIDFKIESRTKKYTLRSMLSKVYTDGPSFIVYLSHHHKVLRTTEVKTRFDTYLISFLLFHSSRS